MCAASHPRQLARFREREQRILAVARHILVEKGFDALTMDAVAEAVHWSKGTIYQHFKSKEDMILGLMLESIDRKVVLYKKAALFRGRPRERLVAVGVATRLFERLHPEHPASFVLIQANAPRSRISAESCQKFEMRNAGCHVILTGVVRDAIVAGDLKLPPGTDPDDVTFAVWSMSFGTGFLLGGGGPISCHETEDPDRAMRRNLHLVLDGLGWKPLSSEWDYEATEKRVMEEAFSEEMKVAGVS